MQRQMRRPLKPIHDKGPMGLKHRLAMAAHLARRNRPGLPKPLRPLHHRRHRNPEPQRHRSAALPSQNRSNNAFPKIIRKSSSHPILASIPARILNQTRKTLESPNRFDQDVKCSSPLVPGA
jgi:hypothetical protein